MHSRTRGARERSGVVLSLDVGFETAFDRLAPQLETGCQVTVFDCQFPVDDDEALDPLPRVDLGVQLLDIAFDEFANLRGAGEVGEVAVLDLVLPRPREECVGLERHEGHDEPAAFTHDDDWAA